MNVSISFNCFSSVELVQDVYTEHEECIDRSVLISKLRRDSTKLSLCKECKVTATRHEQSAARTQTLRKDLLQ
jgi:hypothetical protein